MGIDRIRVSPPMRIRFLSSRCEPNLSQSQRPRASTSAAKNGRLGKDFCRSKPMRQVAMQNSEKYSLGG
jgi:hypothetical protein